MAEEREKRRKAKLEALRAEIQKGFDSGPAEEVDIRIDDKDLPKFSKVLLGDSDALSVG